MQYIKKFENTKPSYNVGDYVFVRRQISKNKVYKGIVKIVNIEVFSPWASLETLNQYITIDILNEEDTGCFLDQDIKRLATKEEIENFEMQRNAKKYNL